MERCLSLDDILIMPAYSEIESRDDIDISVKLFDYTLKIPFVASCMNTVCETDMAFAMWRYGGIGPIHRFNTVEEQVSLLQDLHHRIWSINGPPIAAAIGIKDHSKRLEAIHSLINIVFIDVAHGHRQSIGEMIHFIKKNYPKLIIAAGNVATREGADYLFDSGANIIRLGIGGGSNCSTRIVTGIGVPQASAIQDITSNRLENEFYIADGGIKNSGDIAKCLGLGADLVMIGSLFAGTTESPGHIYEFGTNNKVKVYMGAASTDCQVHNKIKAPSRIVPEGVSCLVPYVGSVEKVIYQLSGGLKSAMSYVGAYNLKEFREKARFVEITQAGYIEGTPHGLYRNERKGNY